MSAEVYIVEPQTVREWMEQDIADLVDVREVKEYQAAHIAGAVLMPLSTFDPDHLPPVQPGRKLVIHCRSGNRCGQATERLLQAGHPGPIHRMRGGIIAWAEAGLPVVTPSPD